MTVLTSRRSTAREALPVGSVSRAIERLDVTFDDESLVANAGLIVPATLMVRLGLEALVNATVRLGGPGRWVAAGPQGLFVGRDDLGGRHAHRSCRHAARGCDATGVAVPGDGSLDAGHVLARVHVRACPPARQGHRRDAPPRLEWRRRARRRADDDRSGLDDLRGARQTEARRRVRLHRGCSATTRSWRPAPRPARCCTLGCARDRAKRGANRFVEELIARVRRAGATGAVGACGPIRGSGPTS